ncbi:lysylphosphatidylglycerol synthase transmembrane domain-containing protein [Bacteroides eggerthii]|uniref:Lysylphosphatidylglycerol synthase transmembrane domain-containing protein n=1 Tax=Bacteroides eggerthii TaxID=28111 RepID=A0ABT7U8H7_9BACE|nr:lysylphosphatidylglycerol synthase transmembrane domain-containing protein [Bacteroides eggerthii]
MKNKLRNLFFLIGVVAVAVMLWKFEMPYDQVLQNVRRAGIWFPAVLLLWGIIYFMNTCAWQVILNAGDTQTQARVPFWKVYKYTVTGFSLNYVTPVGLLGGEPYRIMEVSAYVGKERATSSVILHAMMHIFSHFCFWAFSIVLYLLLYGEQMGWGMGIMMLLIAAFCVLGIYFFMKGYRNGLALNVLHFFARIPFCRKKINGFIERNLPAIERVDQQIAALHAQSRRVFYLSLSLEFFARIVGCLEILFILYIMTDQVSFWDCILIQAFTSLFANLFFFMPMQMGAREGGFALATGGLAMTKAFGVYTSLIVRLREIVWIVIGIALMKVGNKIRKS